MTAQHGALLQTDIVDSTRLSQNLGDAAMAALWQTHDRVSRGLLRQWRGREIDKSDGFLLLFDNAADAVGYALAYHRALALLEPPLQARAGIHAGSLSLRETPPEDVAMGAKSLEVDGLAKPITARVMSLASAGQTLMTQDAKAALGATGLRHQSHGLWRLKGLDLPIELFEIGDDRAVFASPIEVAKAYRVVRHNDLWIPLRDVRHSLPAERDSFVGRQGALQVLAQRFAGGARLVSILGVGGGGKTRLAQRFGWMQLGDYPGGAWFCDLAPASTLDGIAHAVAKGLDMPLGSADPVAQIGNAIAGRGECLVILDNFEQVARLAEATLGQWLDRAPDARFLTTSREVLGLPGEEVLELAPLPWQDAELLFVRRALAVQSDFRPTGADQASIGPLVKLLDGLPLAIELAAARVRVMSPMVLLLRMGERFRLLASTGGRSDRQSTLRKTFDWSWDLLSDPDKSALAQLSVFEGGFTLAAAEAVIDLSAFPGAPWVPDAVQSLVDKSFVRRVSDRRFDLLVSVQDYARQHLQAAGRFSGSGLGAWEAACRRHWDHFADLTEEAATADKCADADNLVAACRRAIARNEGTVVARTLAAAWATLRLRGPYQAAQALAGQALQIDGLRARDQATIEWVAGNASHLLGHRKAADDHFERGLRCASEAGDRSREAWLHCAIGEQLTDVGNFEEAVSRLSSALAWASDSQERLLQCQAFNGLGRAADLMKRSDEARSFYEAAIVIAREMGNSRWEGGLLGNLGGIHHSAGRHAEARAHYERALLLARDAGDRRWEGNTLCNLGLLLHEQGEIGGARDTLESALAASRELGFRRLEAAVLCNLGIVFEALEDLDSAICHYESAVAVCHAIGDTRSAGQFNASLGVARAKASDFVAARAALNAAGTLLVDQDDASRAQFLCYRAHAEAIFGEVAAATQSLQQALTLLDSRHDDSELRRIYLASKRFLDEIVTQSS